MKQAAVLGAQTFLGFALCGKLVERGVPVKAVFDQPGNKHEKRTMEEKWLTIGRNALFTPVCREDHPNLKECGVVFNHPEKVIEVEALHVISMILTNGERAAGENETLIYLGSLYGPWQPATEELNRWAASDFTFPPFHDDPGLFIEDAAAAVIDIAFGEGTKGQSYYLPGNGVRADNQYPLTQKTSLEKGLEQLQTHMELYPFLYGS
ncbi:hypothetical protein [Metabacillus sp. 84]|uniref:hypothetical protein n=1 Tax=Metabacillus sp. 84 TaxID=3404705 RepID=UPI003CFB914C